MEITILNTAYWAASILVRIGLGMPCATAAMIRITRQAKSTTIPLLTQTGSRAAHFVVVHIFDVTAAKIRRAATALRSPEI